MKKLLPLLMTFVFVLAFGLAYADDSMSSGVDRAGKMITNDDLPQRSSDQDNSTSAQMPAGSGIEGSGAGSEVDPDTLKNDSDPAMEPDVKAPAEPRQEPAPEQPGMDTDRPGSGY